MLTNGENQPSAMEQMASLKENLVFGSLRPCNLSKCSKSQIKRYFENTYDLDEYVFSALLDEKDYYHCPDRLRLPVIFYLCHTATFYVNKLLLAGMVKQRVNKHFEIMFETGVDEMSWDDTENYRMGGSYKWPALDELIRYRNQVRDMVLDCIERFPFDLPVTQESPWWSVFMGMEHERIHIETSSVLLRQLPVEMLKKPKSWKYAPLHAETPTGSNELIRVPQGPVEMGKPADFPSYGWDNEYGNTKIVVPEFYASKYLVTNKEFLQFVEDGGYTRKELWTEEGWDWVTFKEAKHPLFWVCSGGCKSGCGSSLASHSHCTLQPSSTDNGACSMHYKYRAMYDILEMPWDWPVDINFHEAKAFCWWKGPDYRLPTESEHHRMRGDPQLSLDANCDPIYQEDFPANINLKFGSSSPVNMFPPTSMGFYDVYGNVWEWVEDDFNGLPGFKTHYLYDDFSSPCFDGKHTMILGGSWASTGDGASRFARYSFRRHFFQHAGFRYVHIHTPNATTPLSLCKADVFSLETGVQEKAISVQNVDQGVSCKSSTNTQFEYETEESLDANLQLQYGVAECYSEPLVKICEDACLKYKVDTSSAIVFGCGTGSTSFQLTRTFEEVIGVDYSGCFIEAATKLSRGETLSFTQGDRTKAVARLPPGVNVDRVKFKQLTWVPNEIEGHGLVLFEFAERLMEPKGWLSKLWECLVPGGLLVIATHKGCSPDRQTLQKWFSLKAEADIGPQNGVSVWQLLA